MRPTLYHPVFSQEKVEPEEEDTLLPNASKISKLLLGVLVVKVMRCPILAGLGYKVMFASTSISGAASVKQASAVSY